MPITLALFTALFFGAADFAGGIATRRSRVVPVLGGSHAVGLAGIVVAALLLADAFSWPDFGLGAIAGAFGGTGIFFLYRRLAVGPMAIVAPLTAVTSAIVPVGADLVAGRSFGGLTWIGIVMAVVAIAIVSAADGVGHGAPVTGTVIVESLLSGVGFGAMFITLDQTDAASAPWPIVASRILTVGLMLVVVLVGPAANRIRLDRRTLGLIAVTGVLDTGSNTLFLYATLEGELAVVAVLSSLYPVVTAGLARVFYDERLSRIQVVGATMALGATLLIAAG